MKVTINKVVDVRGSLITYKLTISDLPGEITADFLSDMDGNHAEWLTPVPMQFDVGEGTLWADFATEFGENERVIADTTYYHEGGVPSAPDAKVVLTSCVWDRDETADEPDGFPTFKIEGTADGVAFKGEISLELDGRDMDMSLNDEANAVLEGGRDLELINAVYASSAYAAASAAYHGIDSTNYYLAPQDALNQIINLMELVPPEEGQDRAVSVFIFRAGAEQVIVTAEGGQHGVDWNVLSVSRA